MLENTFNRMKKLTPSEISFINDYLKNSGVKYVDIRYEMTDHVATALEELDGDFYDNFKEYMVKHKEQLLKSNKEFARKAWINALKGLFENMVSRWGIIIFGVTFCLFCLMMAFMEEKLMGLVFDTVPGIIFLMLVINWTSSNFSKQGESWSGSDKILAVANLLIYVLITLIKPERLIDTMPVLAYYYSAMITFMVMAYVSFIKQKRKYKLQYNG